MQEDEQLACIRMIEGAVDMPYLALHLHHAFRRHPSLPDQQSKDANVGDSYSLFFCEAWLPLCGAENPTSVIVVSHIFFHFPVNLLCDSWATSACRRLYDRGPVELLFRVELASRPRAYWSMPPEGVREGTCCRWRCHPTNGEKIHPLRYRRRWRFRRQEDPAQYQIKQVALPSPPNKLALL